MPFRFADLFKIKARSDGGLPPGTLLPFVNTHANGFFQGVSRMFRQRNREEYLEEYRGIVYAATQAICEEVASIELQLMRGTGPDAEQVFNHPVLDILGRVNSHMTGYDLLFGTQADIELEGNAFWYIPKSPSGVPLAIWPLRPDLVNVIPGKEQWVDAYVYLIGGNRWAIQPENVVHFKTYNPLNPYRGIGTVMASMASIDTQNSIKAWNQAWFDNGARPDTIVEYAGNLQKELRDKMQREWDDQYKGATKSHRTAFVGGGVKIHTLDVSQKEMDFVEQNRLTRDEILSIFRVPQSVLGITEDMTFANAETTDYIFSKRTIKPKMQRLVNTMNEFLLPIFGETELQFTFKDPVPQNREQTLLTYEKGITNSWLTPNEVRKREGLPPIENGDSTLVSSMVVQGGKVIDQPKPVKAVKETKVGVIEAIAKDFAASLTKGIAAASADADFEAKGAEWNTKQRKAADEHIDEMQKLLSDFFDDQKSRVVEKVKASENKAAHLIRNKALNIADVFDEPEEKKKLVDALAAFMKTVVQAEGDAAMELIDAPEDFDAAAGAVKQLVERQTKKFAGKVTKETSKAIRETIASGLADDLSVSSIADNIGDLAAFSEDRAKTIARTEVTRAQANADVEAWKQSGVVVKKIWYTAEDERVCQFCNEMHGKEIALEEVFFEKGDTSEGSDGGELSQDYGDVNGPPLHPNCRCSILPVVEK